MQALVAQTQAAKQDAQQTQVQLNASTEQLDKKVQEIFSLRVSFLRRTVPCMASACEASAACTRGAL